MEVEIQSIQEIIRYVQKATIIRSQKLHENPKKVINMKALWHVLAICSALTLTSCASIDNSGASLIDIRAATQTVDEKWPIIYNDDYNISFAGLEGLHPFDTKKYGRVFKSLKSKGVLTSDNYFTALKPDDSMLERHHSAAYLRSLERSKNIARYTEVSPIKMLPNSVAYNAVVEPAKIAAAGSVLAGELALDYGWAVNLGGGYHHASKNRAGGFCAIADVSLSILHLMDSNPDVKEVMIVDLDAHQGNGHGRDFTGRDDIFILDMYNAEIYPRDTYAKASIDLKVELESFTSDKVYLSKLETAMTQALKESSPDIIYYIAGMDLLEGDPLGKLFISREGIIKRDQIVFGHAIKNNIPIVMLFGGGYQKNNAEIIAESLESVIEVNGLEPKRL